MIHRYNKYKVNKLPGGGPDGVVILPPNPKTDKYLHNTKPNTNTNMYKYQVQIQEIHHGASWRPSSPEGGSDGWCNAPTKGNRCSALQQSAPCVWGKLQNR